MVQGQLVTAKSSEDAEIRRKTAKKLQDMVVIGEIFDDLRVQAL